MGYLVFVMKNKEAIAVIIAEGRKSFTDPKLASEAEPSY
jgi:hypothetical protein